MPKKAKAAVGIRPSRDGRWGIVMFRGATALDLLDVAKTRRAAKAWAERLRCEYREAAGA